jgi:ACR3 family arsenite efflux pump ArsB
MMVIASIGLLANLLSAWVLMRKSDTKDNINVRSAYLHILGDALGSVGAIVAGLFMLLFSWYIADPIISVIVAAGIGLLWPALSSRLDSAISLVLAILMYGMFAQIPFFRLKEALANRRFIYALLVMNYIVVPILVWGLTRFLSAYPPLLLGVYLVLLTPCIDYVIVINTLVVGMRSWF